MLKKGLVVVMLVGLLVFVSGPVYARGIYTFLQGKVYAVEMREIFGCYFSDNVLYDYYDEIGTLRCV